MAFHSVIGYLDGNANTSFKILLGISGSITVFQLYLEWRNYRAIKKQKDIPLGFEGHITEEEFEKGKRYNVDRKRFDIFHSSFSSALSLAMEAAKVNGALYGKSAFWLASLFQRISPLLPASLGISPVTGLSLMGSWKHALFVSAIQDVFQSVLGIPFSYYSNFVVEEKHGFNRMTRKTFVSDFFKSMALRLLFFQPVMIGVVQVVISTFGENFPLYLTLSLVGLMLVFMHLVPTLVVPLFYKLTPLKPEDPLYELLHAHCEASGFSTKKVEVQDGSRRSAHANAMLFGFGSLKRLWLYDTIIDDLTPQEVAGVVRHELGHWRHGHVLKFFPLMIAQVTGAAYGLRGCMRLRNLAREFGYPEASLIPKRYNNSDFISPYIALSIVEYFAASFSFTMTAPLNIISRYFEFQADTYSVTAPGPYPEKEEGDEKAKTRGEVLCSALRKISKKENPLEDDWLYALMEVSHPSLTERINNIKEVEKRIEKKAN